MSRGVREFRVSALNVQTIFSGVLSRMAIARPLSAQVIPSNIVPNASLDSESSQVFSTARTELIAGGADRGQNLFHSFREFNLGEKHTF